MIDNSAVRARRVVGRGKLSIIQTRVPTQVLDYVRAIAVREFGSMTNFFNFWVPIYLAEQPFNNGLAWRQSKGGVSQRQLADGTMKYTSTSWFLLNASVEPDIRNAVISTAKQLNVSMSTFVYTFIYWICAYVYPPIELKS